MTKHQALAFRSNYLDGVLNDFSQFSLFACTFLGLVFITRQMPPPRHINKAIIRLSSHPSRKSLCFDTKLAVVVVVNGLMKTRLYNLI